MRIQPAEVCGHGRGWPGHVQLRKGWRDEFSGVASRGQFRVDVCRAGSGPTLAAAAAWDGLAAELGQAANSFSSATAALADTAWQGPAATAMAAAAAPYASWLSTAATRALSAAAQAKAAAAVYEAARAATVDPLLVAANRHQLVSLVLSNLFGQNAPAIAATEAAYEQLWAADVAAW